MIYYEIENINNLNIDEIKKHVSEERLTKSERYKSEDDKKRSIAVEYVLNRMVREYMPDICTPLKLSYDEHGKPHVTESFEFSLSHSGDYVACIIADMPCGIDIERHSDRDYEKISKRVLSPDEADNIKSKKDFYDLWTVKESVLKAEGLGLALDMRKITVAGIKSRTGDTADGQEQKLLRAAVNGREYKQSIATVNEREYTACILNAPEGYSLSYVYL